MPPEEIKRVLRKALGVLMDLELIRIRDHLRRGTRILADENAKLFTDGNGNGCISVLAYYEGKIPEVRSTTAPVPQVSKIYEMMEEEVSDSCLMPYLRDGGEEMVLEAFYSVLKDRGIPK